MSQTSIVASGGASPGRLAATEALVQLEASGGPIDAVLGHHGASLEGAERRLAWALVLGVERNRLLLDHYLAPHLSRHPRELDAEVRATLRCAAVQILHMNRIPERAAVHQAVEVIKTLDLDRASGLVNASLRSLVRDPERCSAPADPWTANSMPRWLLKRMPGYAAGAFNREPPMALRPRIGGLVRKLLAGGITALDAPSHVQHTGAVLVQSGDPTVLPGWDDGWFAVQDAASQAVVRLVNAQPGEYVLDACAAPGGKALAMADAVGNQGRVTALDISPGRLAMMDGEAKRMGIRNVEPRVGDVTDVVEGVYDRVLVDAPCSSIGTLRRHPEIRWQRRGGDLEGNGVRQSAILHGASKAVKSGGTLVYAVCSFAPEEGPEVVERFLEGHVEFERKPISKEFGPARTEDGAFASWPHQGPWDAFFGVVMRRG